MEYPAVVDSVHNASGFGYMVGMHLKPMDKLNLAIQYQSNTALKYIYDTAEDTTGLFPDGDGIRKDIPPIIATGLSYQLTEDFQLSSSWTIYLNTFSKQGMN